MSQALELGLTRGPGPSPYAYAVANLSCYDLWRLCGTLRKQLLDQGLVLREPACLATGGGEFLSSLDFEEAMRGHLRLLTAAAAASSRSAPAEVKRKSRSRSVLSSVAADATVPPKGQGRAEAASTPGAVIALNESLRGHFHTRLVLAGGPEGGRDWGRVSAVVLFSLAPKVGVEPYKCAVKYAQARSVSQVFIVSQSGATHSTRKLAARAAAGVPPLFVHCLVTLNLLWDPRENVLVPPHRALTAEETRELFAPSKRRNITPEHLPWMLANDCQIAHLRLPLGHIVEARTPEGNPHWYKVADPLA